LVGELGIASTLAQHNLISSWPEVVGKKIASVTMPEHIEHRVLFVKVASAPWRAELAMRRREIIDKLNSKAGGRLLKDICFR
jgi:predicted nucleic acid-binding Zn ribbon protein